MALIETLIGPLALLLDKLICDKEARARAKLELLELEGTQELCTIEAQLAAIVAEAGSSDPWTSRARPSLIYVMYALRTLPIGVLVQSAFSSATAHNIAAGMNAYFAGFPEPFYALFGTGHLGYTAARQWGKVKAWIDSRWAWAQR